MKRQIKKIAQMIIVFCFTGMLFSACNDAGEEIFDNADVQIEQATDEEDEAKRKPGG